MVEEMPDKNNLSGNPSTLFPVKNAERSSWRCGEETKVLGFDRSHFINLKRDWIVDRLDVVQPVQEMRPPGAEDRVFPALKAALTTISQVECKG
jgi:hypothetical protein